MAVSNPYRVLEIPPISSITEPASRITALAEKYRSLRLEALQTNPEAFGSTYESEIDYPLSRTIERIQSSQAAQFIAFRESETENSPNGEQPSDLDVLLSSEWVGMVVLVGPQETDPHASTPLTTSDPFVKMAAARAASEEEGGKAVPEKLHFTINATFVQPTVRKAGVGVALMRRALQAAKEIGLKRGSAIALVDLGVNLENENAKKLYEKAGFRVVSEERYTQRPRVVDGVMREVEKLAWKMEVEIPVQD